VIAGQIASAARASSSAALWQAHTAGIDSVRVESPLPGGVAQVVRFLLSAVPPWIQIGGVFLGVLVAAAVIWVIVKRRREIFGWLGTRSRPVQIALAIAAVAVVAGSAGAGAVTWNYTQHSNDFCMGCHVMDGAVERMTGGESKHAKLSCHDCHQQPISASMWQLYLWVKERPEEIKKHADVPNSVCEKCHVTQDTAQWQRIASTAGHRVHMESDSLPLRNIQCIECHGTELHQFQPVKETCGQSACHKPADTDIVLGKMAEQTARHCTSCHQFTADVPLLATTDSASGTLVPGQSQCFSCHEMRQVLADFDERRDPHGGKCGMCHNPHTQETPQAAANSCATSGCHSNWRDEPFHMGQSHKNLGSRCLTCHMPHASKVDASSCQSCHERVRARGPYRPPLPFDTAAALRRSDAVPEREHRVSILPPENMLVRLASVDSNLLTAGFGVGPPPAAPAEPDSFPHSRHEKLACLECHQTGDGHGELTFERPRGCAICHHQAPARSRCATCHQTAEYGAPRTATATVRVPGNPPRPRPVEFLHSAHTKKQCVDCHTTPVSLAPEAAKATCRDCHEDHHAAGRSCSSCHRITDPKVAHKTLEAAHQRCDACHTGSTVARLTPTRSFCSTCHTAKTTGHYDAKECSACHFLADPASLRPKLTSRSGQ
jgi:nitrate/TMAO reductase-like tetraheme cytochrome c subunit